MKRAIEMNESLVDEEVEQSSASLETEDLIKHLSSDLHKPQSLEPSTIEPSTSKPQFAIEESQSRTLEESANLLISVLDASLRDYMFEIADLTLKIPRWQLILGAVVSQYQTGALIAPSIDPSWKDSNVLTKSSINFCEQCKKPFTPKRYGQRFCSNHCGDKSRFEDIKLMRAKREEELRVQRMIEKAQMGGSR